MPRRTPPDRRERILAAARDAFAARGYAGTRLDDIAAAAGISKAALYLQFADKAELFRALVDSLLAANIPPPAFAEAGPPPSVAEALRALIAHAVTLLTEGDVAFLPRLVIGEGGNFPEIARAYYDRAIATVLGMIAGLVEHGVATGEFRAVDPRLAAKSIAGGVVIATLWRTVFEPVGAEPLDLPAMAAHHADLLLNGLQVRGEAR